MMIAANTSDAPQSYSKIYQTCLLYISASIVFEFLNQLLFFRLLGVPYVAETMLSLRLLVDTLLVMACFSFGIQNKLFRGAAVNTLFVLTVWGTVLGFINQNSVPVVFKDIILIGFFLLKFVIFKAVLTSNEDLTKLFRHLVKYCLYTLYIAIFSLVTLQLMRRAGLSFYPQGISNVEWYVAYALSINRTIAATVGVLVAFLLAKRMVFVSCAVMFLNFTVLKLAKLNRKVLISLIVLTLVTIIGLQFFSFSKDMFYYATRLDFEGLLYELKDVSVQAVLKVLYLMDPGRYTESLSAIQELKFEGVLMGGGFGFNYTDMHTHKIVSNAHFSPVGLVTKFGIFGMVAFYALVSYPMFPALRADHFAVRLCGLYLLATVVGSMFAWKFFLSSPLLPLALAVCWYRKIIVAADRANTSNSF